MGIFRRQRRGRHSADESVPAANGPVNAPAPAADQAPLPAATDAEFIAGSAPAVPAHAHPTELRPTNFSPESVASSIAADAERFVATFPYAASPVREGALDFSRASLVHIEAMLAVLHEAGRPLPERLHHSIGVYLFETVRREFGGRYLRFDDLDPLVLLVGEPRAEVLVCAISRVAARVEHGPDESIVHFYASIAPLIAEGAEITLR